jgi:hypothetical protein
MKQQVKQNVDMKQRIRHRNLNMSTLPSHLVPEHGPEHGPEPRCFNLERPE